VSAEREDMIPAVEGETCRNGYFRAVDQLGYRWFVSRDVLTRRRTTGSLSDEQIERIRAFKEILREHDRVTLEQAVDNFRRDAHPEPEIQLFERIARVYQISFSAGEAAAGSRLHRRSTSSWHPGKDV
jgi:hypothetical protein